MYYTMGALSLRLSDDLEAVLDARAEADGRAKSEVVRVALEAFLRPMTRERSAAHVVRDGKMPSMDEAEAVSEERIARQRRALVEAGHPSVEQFGRMSAAVFSKRR